MKKRLIAAVLTALLLSGCASAQNGGESAPYSQITQEQASRMLAEEKDYILLDVRTQEEFDEGHIPGAICIPHDSITTADIPQLPDKKQLILVYCRSGRRSKLAAGQLSKNGYTNVVEFGGVNTWTGELTKE
jgi:rhodanese-related sulfurtransferase